MRGQEAVVPGTSRARGIVTVSGDAAAVALARELVRNRATARPERAIGAAPGAAAALAGGLWRHAVLEHVTPAGEVVVATASDLRDPATYEAVAAAASGGAETIVLEAAGDPAPEVPSGSGRLTVVRPDPAAPRDRTVVLVAGAGHQPAPGAHRLTATALRRLRHAERLAAATPPPAAVILSGFDGWAGGPTEAEQLRRSWTGPPVPLLLDDAARSTAENALFGGALAHAMGGVRRLVVVASWWTVPRQLVYGLQALRGTGIALQVSVAPTVRTHPAAVLRELDGLGRLRRHWRQALAYRRGGPAHPGAEPRSRAVPRRL